MGVLEVIGIVIGTVVVGALGLAVLGAIAALVASSWSH